jgi:membrane-associated protease RseP (regulator of RpoE activity)
MSTLEIILYASGAALFILGLAISIGLHELGHMVTAKSFGVKVLDFSVGFGPRIWGRVRGETSYNIRAIPLGGYIRMIGMFPPTSKPGNAEFVTLAPEDWSRTFSKLTPTKKAVVMFAGPFMNLVLAVVITTLAVVGLGLPEPINKIGYIAPCLSGEQACDTPSPAAKSELRVGDVVVSVAGVEITRWDDLTAAIDLNAGELTPFTVLRSGEQRILYVEVAALSGSGRIGVSPGYELVRGDLSDSLRIVWDSVARVGSAIANFPKKTYELARIIVTGSERDPAGPIGVVGLARFSGEVASAAAPVTWRLVDLLMLLGALNVSLFVFNLVPLLPLDGGHVLSAVIEGFRKAKSRFTGNAEPGPFDGSKLLPLTYLVAAFLIFSALLVMFADIFKPLQVG